MIEDGFATDGIAVGELICSCLYFPDFHSIKQRQLHLPLQRRSCLVPPESLQPSQKNINKDFGTLISFNH